LRRRILLLLCLLLVLAGAFAYMASASPVKSLPSAPLCSTVNNPEGDPVMSQACIRLVAQYKVALASALANPTPLLYYQSYGALAETFWALALLLCLFSVKRLDFGWLHRPLGPRTPKLACTVIALAGASVFIFFVTISSAYYVSPFSHQLVNTLALNLPLSFGISAFGIWAVTVGLLSLHRGMIGAMKVFGLPAILLLQIMLLLFQFNAMPIQVAQFVNWSVEGVWLVSNWLVLGVTSFLAVWTRRGAARGFMRSKHPGISKLGLLLLAVFLVVSPMLAAVHATGYVQQCPNSAASPGSSITCALGSTVTSGDFLECTVVTVAGTVTGVTDGIGTSWVSQVTVSGATASGSSTVYMYMYTTLTTGGASDTITVALTGSPSSAAVDCGEFSSISSATKAGSTTGAATSTGTSATYAVSQASFTPVSTDLVIWAYFIPACAQTPGWNTATSYPDYAAGGSKQTIPSANNGANSACDAGAGDYDQVTIASGYLLSASGSADTLTGTAKGGFATSHTDKWMGIAAYFTSSTVTEKVTITVDNSGTQGGALTILASCHPSVSTIAMDGAQHTFTSDTGCAITYTVPSDTGTARYRWSGTSTTWGYTTGAAGGTDTKSQTLYFQVLNTYQASTNGVGPPAWQSPALTFAMSGTVSGSAATVCTITAPTSGTATAKSGCQISDGFAWSDSGRAVTPVASVVGSGTDIQWKVYSGGSNGPASISPTTGNNVETAFTYYKQVGNTFQITAHAQSTFDAGLVGLTVTGTLGGTGGSTVCTITPTSAATDVCSTNPAYSDYSTTINGFTTPLSQGSTSCAPATCQWVSASGGSLVTCSFATLTTGGNTENCDYYKQLKNAPKALAYDATTPVNWYSGLSGGIFVEGVYLGASSVMLCGSGGQAAVIPMSSSYQVGYCGSSTTPAYVWADYNTALYWQGVLSGPASGTQWTVVGGNNGPSACYDPETTVSNLQPCNYYEQQLFSATLAANPSGVNFYTPLQANITGSLYGTAATKLAYCGGTATTTLSCNSYNYPTPGTSIPIDYGATATFPATMSYPAANTEWCNANACGSSTYVPSGASASTTVNYWYELYETYYFVPMNPTAWGSSVTVSALANFIGSGATACSTASGTGVWVSCSGYGDYNAPVAFGNPTSGTTRWATADTDTPTTGGNTYYAHYYKQLYNTFTITASSPTTWDTRTINTYGVQLGFKTLVCSFSVTAASAQSPTCTTWTDYNQVMDFEDSNVVSGTVWISGTQVTAAITAAGCTTACTSLYTYLTGVATSTTTLTSWSPTVATSTTTTYTSWSPTVTTTQTTYSPTVTTSTTTTQTSWSPTVTTSTTMTSWSPTAMTTSTSLTTITGSVGSPVFDCTLLTGGATPYLAFSGGTPSPSPASEPCDGNAYSVAVDPTAVITAAEPAPSAHVRYLFPGGSTAATCSAPCTTFALNDFEQLTSMTFTVVAPYPQLFDSGRTFNVSVLYLGVRTVACQIMPSQGDSSASCSAQIMDYGSQVIFSDSNAVSGTAWVCASPSPPQTTGGVTVVTSCSLLTNRFTTTVQQQVYGGPIPTITQTLVYTLTAGSGPLSTNSTSGPPFQIGAYAGAVAFCAVVFLVVLVASAAYKEREKRRKAKWRRAHQ
jgi:hypothetical protein